MPELLTRFPQFLPFFLSVLLGTAFGITPPVLAEQAQNAADENFFAFSYFTGNGEDGLHLLISRDALNWQETNGGKSYLPPIRKGLMRDPSLCQAPDGTFHLVWTTRWFDHPTFGHSTSRDLIHWTEPEEIPVMESEPTTRNVWAPEVFFDAKSGYFYVVWASTIPGRFSETVKGTSEDALDHRQYFTKTKDWKTFTPSRLFFEPGHCVIDAFMAEKEGTYFLFFKDETLKPVRKTILLATAPSPEGPWSVQGQISPTNWVEGPAALDLGTHWLVCYDRYTKHAYGAITSEDGKTWKDVSDQFHVPADIRHGTMIRVSREVYEGLKTK